MTGEVGDFTPNLLMLRFDEAVFVPNTNPTSLPGHAAPEFR